ncbi:T9SS type A sorting domain-containing protein [Flavobacterium sp.]|uniref:T9SS type A sorting domain-containing protein n=1 Tax=Flavobacterium sp. TaxID=239 RepID=UPI0038D15341
MKKLYILLLSAVASVSFGQTIYSENMGVPTGTTLIPAYVTGTAPATFQNAAPIVYSGTGDVRVTSASSTYTGASGGGNVYLTGTAGKYFQIDGINTSAYSSANIQMTFGYLTATFATVQVILEYSTDASATTPTWTPISFTNNTSAAWNLVSIPGGVLPSSSSLSLRFTQPTVAGQIRIDDIKIFNYNPACTLVLATATGACDAVTYNIDTYTATIPFTGGGTGSYTITPTAGTVAGDNPGSVATGNILINGVPEGTNLTVNVVSGVCSYQSVLTAPTCKPVNTLPYNEPFPYAAGTALGSSQKWTNLNTGDDILGASGNLTYNGYAATGNSVTFTGAGIDCITPFTSTTSGTIYASFLVNVTDLSTMTATTPTTYFAGLTDAAKNYKGRLFITKSGTQYQFGLDAASTTTNLDATLRNAGDVQLVIMSYDFSTLTLKAWINPDLTTFDVAVTAPTLSQVLTTAIADLGGFILRQDTATTTPTIIFDELRIDTAISGVLSSNQVNTIAGLKVYPNPVSNGTLFIESDLNSDKNVAIFDVLGKQVFNATTSNNAINVSQLKTGIYMVRITEEGNTVTKKLVIK